MIKTQDGVHIDIQNLTHCYSKHCNIVADRKKEGFTQCPAKNCTVTFENVNFEAKPGESLVIIGRSGCGKSTLLQITAGLLAGTCGEVRFNDELVTKTSPHWVMMFQAPHLFPWMTVERNIGIGLHFAGWKKEKKQKRVEEVIELVGLQEYAQNNVQDLSGGQQQRVALARSLVMEPDLLLLDEPFSALDTFTRTALQKDVRAIAKKIGFNLMMVTHDIDEAVLMADRILVMAGSPGEITNDLTIDLSDPRERDSKQVKNTREHLMQVFHTASNA